MHSSIRAETLWVVAAVVAVLYFGQEVLIPFALAILFSFLLGPLASRLRRWRLGRVPSVLATVLAGVLVVVGLGSFITLQVYDVARKLPNYERTIRAKLQSVRVPGIAPLQRTFDLLRESGTQLGAPAPVPGGPDGAAGAARRERQPVPVEIREPVPKSFQYFQQVAGPMLRSLATAGIVTVFVMFMLIYQEDLRDRLLRVMGLGQLHLTIEVLDEAAQRVSRYLLSLLCVNVLCGVLVALGLWAIGVPNPILWGVLVAVLRFIPYAGIMIAASLPLALAFAVSPGWTMLLQTLGLFVGVEVCMYNFVEPLLYGSSTGLTPLAILFGAVFWTWLWGPLGLLMSTPLMVCVVVLGRHFPSLEIFDLLLGDRPALAAEARLDQRLPARDPVAETQNSEKQLTEK